MKGGMRCVHPPLSQPKDIFQRHNGRINNHANGKGQPGKRNNIDRQAKPGNRHKCADNRNRDCRKDNNRRHDSTEKQQQNRKGQNTANPDILLHKVNRRGNIFGFVIDHLQA